MKSLCCWVLPGVCPLMYSWVFFDAIDDGRFMTLYYIRWHFDFPATIRCRTPQCIACQQTTTCGLLKFPWQAFLKSPTLSFGTMRSDQCNWWNASYTSLLIISMHIPKYSSQYREREWACLGCSWFQSDWTRSQVADVYTYREFADIETSWPLGWRAHGGAIRCKNKGSEKRPMASQCLKIHAMFKGATCHNCIYSNCKMHVYLLLCVNVYYMQPHRQSSW